MNHLKASLMLRCVSGFILLCAACSSPPVTAAEPPEPAPDPVKIGPPVTLALTSTATVGRVVATLSVKATGAIPNARASFVVPEGVKVVSGELETTLGSLAAGDERAHTITLEVPASGHFQLFGGVLCEMGPDVRLSKAEVLVLGTDAPPPDPSRVIRTPGASTGVRLAPMKKKQGK